LPVYTKDLEEIIMISEDKGVKEQLEIYASDLENLRKIGKEGKAYFEKYCTVLCQADYLMTLISK
jgi:methylthioribose-1-phosphate isomerase